MQQQRTPCQQRVLVATATTAAATHPRPAWRKHGGAGHHSTSRMRGMPCFYPKHMWQNKGPPAPLAPGRTPGSRHPRTPAAPAAAAAATARNLQQDENCKLS